MYTQIMKIRKMLISYVQLDHTLYSTNYGIIACVDIDEKLLHEKF